MTALVAATGLFLLAAVGSLEHRSTSVSQTGNVVATACTWARSPWCSAPSRWRSAPPPASPGLAAGVAGGLAVVSYLAKSMLPLATWTGGPS